MSRSIWGSCAAQYGWAFATTPSSRNRPRSSGWMTWMWAMCGRVSLGPFARRAASTASSPSRTARSPIAWKCGWKPSASSRVTASASVAGLDLAQAAVRGRSPVPVQVRLEDGTREVLEHAVEHELDAGRRIAAARRPRPALDQLLDLFRPAVALPPQGAHDAAGQLAPTGERGVGELLLVGRHDGVLPVRDAQGVQLGTGRAEVPRRGRRAWWPAATVRRARSPLPGARRSAARRGRARSGRRRVGGLGGDPGQLERLRVDPGRVAVAALEVDRPIGRDAVEVRAVRDPAREVRHRPAVADDPRLVGVGGGVGRHDLEVVIQPTRALEAAAQPAQPGANGMDVRVPEARRDGPAAQPDDAGPRADRDADLVVASNRDDPAAPDRDRLGPATSGVHRRDPATEQDEVGRRIGSGAPRVVGHAARMAWHPPPRDGHPVRRDGRSGCGPRA